MTASFAAPAVSERPRLVELESLRGLAALLVVLYHLPAWNTVLHEPVLVRNGALMVEFFFVLSGFVIASSYDGRLNTMQDAWRFQMLRFGRLYPVHLLFLLVFLGLEFLKLYAEQRHGISSPTRTPFVQNSPQAFVEHLLLLQAILQTGNQESFNGPSWSISVEFYTYAVFALVALFLRRRQYLAWALIVLITATLIAVGVSELRFFTRCLCGFFLGCLTAKLTQRDRFPRLLDLGVVPPLCALLLVVYFMRGQPARLAVFAVTVWVIAAVVRNERTGRSGPVVDLLRSRWLVWLGTVSYSLYMCHTFVIWVANNVVRFLLHRQERIDHGESAPQLLTWEALIAIVATVALSLLVSYFVYRLVEDPWRHWFRARLAVSKRKVGAGLPVDKPV
ncbi:MAG TPA: acyltransferase [Roseateles sp.]